MSDYEELPCSKYGRIWKLAFDKKDTPCCPEGIGCKADVRQDKSDDVVLAQKIASWYRTSYKAVCGARAFPDAILEKMPADLVILMAHNDIHLVYKGETDDTK